MRNRGWVKGVVVCAVGAFITCVDSETRTRRPRVAAVLSMCAVLVCGSLLAATPATAHNRGSSQAHGSALVLASIGEIPDPHPSEPSRRTGGIGVRSLNGSGDPNVGSPGGGGGGGISIGVLLALAGAVGVGLGVYRLRSKRTARW